MTRRRKDAYDPEQARLNVESWHEIFGPAGTRDRLPHYETMLRLEGELREHLVKTAKIVASSEHFGRGDRWSATYAVRRSDERLAFYQACVDRSKELLA